MGCTATTLKTSPTDGETSANWIDYKSGDKFCSTDKNFVAKIRVAKTGAAAMKPTTVGEIFKMAAKSCPNQPAYRFEDPCPEFGKEPKILETKDWKAVTYSKYYADCRKVARAFVDLGMKPLDAVNIYGFNSPEWFMGLYGAILGGGVAAGIYPTDTPEQVLFKSRHSGGAIAVVQGAKQAKIFGSVVDKLPLLKAIVQWDETSTIDSAGFKRSDGSVVKYMSFKDLLANEPTTTDADLDKLLQAQQPGSVCAYIYTSGTTGNPKAVMISHDNILYESKTIFDVLKKYAGVGTEPERIISYLPLSHVAGMMVDMICPIVCAALNAQPCTVHFARAYDLKKSTIKDRLVAVKPTLFLGVPRVWEKIAAALKKKVRSAPPPSAVKKCIVDFSKKKGLEFQQSRQLGGSGCIPCCYCIAEKTVQKTVKSALGLECCKYGFTGAAPISKETLEFFGVLGLQINEVYGMSECTGATTVSVDQAHVWGSCGWRMPGAEVKVFRNQTGALKECPRAKDIFNPTDDEQGEICFRGRHIMTGYMANPDLGKDHLAKIDGKLKAAIDDEGWLHSGDKGCMSETGMVKITGRYKELIIGAGGENVAPVPIENAVKKFCPAISNCMMVGDKKPFMAAFVTLKAKGATGNEPGGDDLDEEALEVDPSVTKISEAVKSDKFKKHLIACVIKANKEAAPNNASTIKKICILPRDFSVATNELTPTLKLKRSVVAKMQAASLDAIYKAPKDCLVVPYVPTGGADDASSKTTDDAPASKAE